MTIWGEGKRLKPNQLFPSGERCARLGCKTTLSIYNPSNICATCHEKGYPYKKREPTKKQPTEMASGEDLRVLLERLALR